MSLINLLLVQIIRNSSKEFFNASKEGHVSVCVHLTSFKVPNSLKHTTLSVPNY